MGDTRAAIEAIQDGVNGELMALVIQEGDRDPDVEAETFATLTNNAVWEAIYTLSDHIDRLRK